MGPETGTATASQLRHQKLGTANPTILNSTCELSQPSCITYTRTLPYIKQSKTQPASHSHSIDYSAAATSCSCSFPALNLLHSTLCAFQCATWQSRPQYTTDRQPVHFFSLPPPGGAATPHPAHEAGGLLLPAPAPASAPPATPRPQQPSAAAPAAVRAPTPCWSDNPTTSCCCCCW